MKNTFETLKRYLQYWDPIGVIEDLIIRGLPPDEYDSYAGPLYTLLNEGASVDQVEDYLKGVLGKMGLQYSFDRDRPVAEGIHKYFNNQLSFRK